MTWKVVASSKIIVDLYEIAQKLQDRQQLKVQPTQFGCKVKPSEVKSKYGTSDDWIGLNRIGMKLMVDVEELRRHICNIKWT